MEEETPVAPCVQCGYCCRVAPCAWGERVGPRDRSCRFLVADASRPGRFLCGLYDQIIGQTTSEMAPAFGAGCSSTLFNTARRTILQQERHDANASIGQGLAGGHGSD